MPLDALALCASASSGKNSGQRGNRGQNQSGQGQSGGQGMQGGGGGGMGLMMPSVVTATDRFVFVLRGNTLYQYDINGLLLLAQAQSPATGGTSTPRF